MTSALSKGSNLSAFIRLEDGRVLWGTSVGMAGLYTLIAECITDDFGKLKKWLLDIADRPNPFMDFDLEGLEPSMRAEFYTAAKRAYCQHTSEDPSLVQTSACINRLDRLLAMHESILRGEPPLALSDSDYVFEPMEPPDLDQIWNE